MNRILFYLKLILAVFWTAFIIYGLLSEPSEIPRFPWLAKPGIDKLIHAVLFAIESGLLAWGVLSQKPWLNIIWCFLLGAGLEVLQHLFVSGRYGDVWDLLADVVGAAFGMWIISKFRKKF